MSILEAIKYQSPDTLYAYGINPKTYIYKKYKIDSLQFIKSNTYYAADYREYKKMYDALSDRLKKEKAAVDLIIKKAKAKKVQDSIKKVKKTKELKIKKEKDSIIAQKKKDSIAKKKKSTEVKKMK